MDKVKYSEEQKRKLLQEVKEGRTIAEAVNNILNTELSELVKTITADRGKEFALHNEIEDIHKVEFYFCDPYSSWQRGANEQLNGLLREFSPKKTEFDKISDKELEEAINKINNRPRKCLDYKTPNEVFEALTTVSNLVQ